MKPMFTVSKLNINISSRLLFFQFSVYFQVVLQVVPGAAVPPRRFSGRPDKRLPARKGRGEFQTGAVVTLSCDGVFAFDKGACLGSLDEPLSVQLLAGVSQSGPADSQKFAELRPLSITAHPIQQLPFGNIIAP